VTRWCPGESFLQWGIWMCSEVQEPLLAGATAIASLVLRTPYIWKLNDPLVIAGGTSGSSTFWRHAAQDSAVQKY
jgi:hypothetical protein